MVAETLSLQLGSEVESLIGKVEDEDMPKFIEYGGAPESHAAGLAQSMADWQPRNLTTAEAIDPNATCSPPDFSREQVPVAWGVRLTETGEVKQVTLSKREAEAWGRMRHYDSKPVPLAAMEVR